MEKVCQSAQAGRWRLPGLPADQDHKVQGESDVEVATMVRIVLHPFVLQFAYI